MRNSLKQRVARFIEYRAEQDEKAADFLTLLAALPKGHVKQILKDETCQRILEKYGITE